jgi:hypothetical protein
LGIVNLAALLAIEAVGNYGELFEFDLAKDFLKIRPILLRPPRHHLTNCWGKKEVATQEPARWPSAFSRRVAVFCKEHW